MLSNKDVKFDIIKSETGDDYSDDSLFNISSWGADLSFREIISMYDENELVKPELQRKYVWDKSVASRFIESLLMGLPVPSVFFAKVGSQKLIVDGYQRIMTVYDYVRGVFSGDGRTFRLSNSEKINKRWRNKSFSELSVDDQRRIRSTTIHAIVFEQKAPLDDDTSLYQIFERINTGGRPLMPQEIRNCVYQGPLNKLLFELNENTIWRSLYGSSMADSRMKDIECILRFFVMKSSMVQNCDKSQIPLKKFLNKYMGDTLEMQSDEIDILRSEFINTMTEIYDCIGQNAFRTFNGKKYSKNFNPAIFDAVSVGFYNALNKYNKIQGDFSVRHKQLFTDEVFLQACSQHTTNMENIHIRIQIVENMIEDGISDESKTV